MGTLLQVDNGQLIMENMQSYLRQKIPDCSLYSEDGYKFMIHKEVLCQTTFLRKILAISKNYGLNDEIDIFCPFMSKTDLEYLVQFLYYGKIPCDNEKISCQILENLNKLFGFPNSMVLALPNNAGICTINVENKEVPIEKFNANDKSRETNNQSDFKGSPEIITNDETVHEIQEEDIEITNKDDETKDKEVNDNILEEFDKFETDYNDENIEDQNSDEKYLVPRNSQPKLYLCQYCNICHFETFSQLNEHISSVHPFLSTIIIPGISNENQNSIQGESNKGEWLTSTFTAQSQVQNEDLSTIKYNCDFCQKSFSFKQARNRHVNNVHLQMRRWQCEICNKKFKQGSTLKHHILARHKKIKPWLCQHCEMSFTQKSNLRTHVKTVHENVEKRPYKCQTCNASFLDASRLSAHISIVHLSKKVGEIINDEEIDVIQNALDPISTMKVQD